VLAGAVAGIGVLIFSAVVLYFTQVNALMVEMNDSFSAIHELQSMRADYKIEDERFKKTIDIVRRKTGAIKFKPFFEKKAKEIGVTLENLSDKQLNMSSENPLSERVKEVQVKFSMSKVSIPRMLNFLIEVEKSNNLLRVQDLNIKARYGTRHFFDSNIVFRGYKVD
jgi:hypothetical protein